MKRTLLLISATLSLASLPAFAASTMTNEAMMEGPNRMKTAEHAARRGLMALPSLVTPDNYQAMGFASLDEVRSAELGTAVERRVVGYDALLRMAPGTKLPDLYAAEETVYYPVQVRGAVRSAMAISKQGEVWQISGIGDRQAADLLAEAVALRAKGMQVSVISVPGLNLDFVGAMEGTRLMLVPIRDYPEVQMEKGKAVEAGEALTAIGAYAKEFDRKYGDEIRKRRLVR